MVAVPPTEVFMSIPYRFRILCVVVGRPEEEEEEVVATIMISSRKIVFILKCIVHSFVFALTITVTGFYVFGNLDVVMKSLHPNIGSFPLVMGIRVKVNFSGAKSQIENNENFLLVVVLYSRNQIKKTMTKKQNP